MIRRMSQSLTAVVLGLVLLAGGGFGGSLSPRPARVDLTVSAAISLKAALDEAKQIYMTENPNVVIAANYGASGSLQLQIEQGAPVDIFLSAAPKQMDALEMKGLLLNGTRKNLFGNEVVLIVPKDSSTGISSFQDLTRADVKHVALGEPVTVPAGQYAKEVLISLGIYLAVKAKAVLGKDVRQVLTYVETGDVNAGIVYATDAKTSSKVKIVETAPVKSHSPVLYPAAVISASKNPAAAQGLLDFLASQRGLALFKKYGFTAPNV